jgi:hypothetical protein
MPSLASGCRDCTAWAATCAVEWRRMLRPSALSILTGSTTSSADSGRWRSRSSPLTRTATMLRSFPNRSSPVVVVSVTRCSRVSSEAMVIDMLDTYGFLP